MTTSSTLTPTPDEIVHRTPPLGEALTPCCRRTPFELPLDERMTNFPELVTCGVQPEAQMTLGQEETPVRPYLQDGEPSAGYAGGSRPSAAAEPARASVQGLVLTFLRLAGRAGLTGHEANDAIGKPRQTSGQAALSVLHLDGLAARLTETRDGQSVYVAVEHVAGRPTEQRGRHGAKACHVCGAEQL